MRTLKDIRKEHKYDNKLEIAILNEIYVSNIFPYNEYIIEISSKDKKPVFHIKHNDNNYICSIESGEILSNNKNDNIEYKAKEWLNEDCIGFKNNQLHSIFIWIGLGKHSLNDFSKKILDYYDF